MRKHLLLAAFAALLSVPAFCQGWLELPGSAHPSRPSICIVATQYMDRDGESVRSHTFRYDPTLRISLWVAYPLNAGLIGEGSRGEGWHPSGLLPEDLQPDLFKGFAYGSGYDRGHQIPSADRLDREINEETFVYINATPQLHGFNGGIWTDFERLVRTWAKRSDTLYVVTGALPGKERISDNDGRPVNIPAGYYKTVLRRNTDKRGVVHWSMCAVFIPHYAASYPERTWKERVSLIYRYAVSVKELELMVEENFFPNLEEIIGKTETKRLKEEFPSPDDWWWK